MIVRYKGNPIIKPSDVKPSHKGYKVIGAFNPGAVKFKDEVILLLRVAEKCRPQKGLVRVPHYRFEDGKSYPEIYELEASDPEVRLKDTRGVTYKGQDYLSTISHIRLARSSDGIKFKVEDKPFIYPTNETEEYGVEDARVTYLEGKYYINFTAVSKDSWATALAVTNDFKKIKKLGLIFHPENKDAAIFPEKVGGKYIALHRPNNSGFGKASIWYSESPDLIHWGNHQCILRPRNNKWESMKIGGGAPPIKTPKGWLVIYHGKGNGSFYSLFALLLDLKKPNKVVKRGEKPILIPKEPYEKERFFPNVVFSSGIVEMDEKLYIYYGASDETTCLAITDVDNLLKSF